MTGSLQPFRNLSSARTFALVAGLGVLAISSASAVAIGIDWSAHADAGTVVILNANEDGSRRETTIWLCVSEGQGYVRGGSGCWVGNTLRNGDVTLRVGEAELAVRATKLTDKAKVERVTAAFRAKYGFGDVMATLVRGDPTIFRLEAR